MADRGHIANPYIVIPDRVMRIGRDEIVMKEPHVRQIKDGLLMQGNCLSWRRIRAIGKIPASQRQADAIITCWLCLLTLQ